MYAILNTSIYDIMRDYDFEKFGRNDVDLTAQQCINRWERLKYWIENDIPDPDKGPTHGFHSRGTSWTKEMKIVHCESMIKQIEDEGV